MTDIIETADIIVVIDEIGINESERAETAQAAAEAAQAATEAIEESLGDTEARAIAEAGRAGAFAGAVQHLLHSVRTTIASGLTTMRALAGHASSAAHQAHSDASAVHAARSHVGAWAGAAAGYARTAAYYAGLAQTAATAAAGSLDSFDDRYLGAFASDPTLDNDGDALLTGALYWNTTTGLKIYDGAAWDPYSATAGILSLLEDTSPQLGGQLDVNGFALGDGTLELLKFSETASAVNEVTIKNAATGAGPEVQATGDDTNIDLNLVPKGTGVVKTGSRIIASAADPGADRVMIWDESANDWVAATLNPGLSITGTTIYSEEVHGIALSDETTAITTGTLKASFYLPYAFTVTSVFACLGTAASSLTTVDINEGGTTILSTKLTIDSGEPTSGTAATPAVISDASLAANTIISFDIDGAGTGGKGLKVFIRGYRT